MYGYTEAGNRWRQQQELKSQFKEWVGQKFNEGDCFVTLTFKPSIQFDETKRSLDVKHFLKRLNRKVYGKAFELKHAQLKCAPIFEFNCADGIHVHIILERPEYMDRFNGRFEDLVIDTWLEMDNAGVRKAQDARTCYNVDGALGYMTKQINISGHIRFDYNNFYWK
jgi:hypothetical protein